MRRKKPEILVSKLRETLEAAAKETPPIAVKSGREVVRVARQQLDELRNLGFSDEKIAEILNSIGVTLSPSTLSAYLRHPNQPETMGK